MLCFSILMGNSFRMHKRRDGGILRLLRLTLLVIALITASRERGVDDCIVVENLVSVIGYLVLTDVLDIRQDVHLMWLHLQHHMLSCLTQ